MVNPTRMELRKVRAKLKTAQKGHELLKEKMNELIRNFYSIIKQTKQLRMEVEKQLKIVFENYETAKTRLSENEIKLLFLLPSKTFDYNFTTTSYLSVEVPKVELTENTVDKNMPYSPLSSTTRMDKAVSLFYELFPQIVALGEIEKSAILLANEIEKCKRRVNALENVIMPKYQQTIDNIEFKLAENERGTISKLMKVKDMIVKDENNE